MKLLRVNLARSIWFGQILDFNPTGISFNLLSPFLAGIYKFKKFPSPTELIDLSKGLHFEGGEFISQSSDLPIVVNFTILNDGAIADTAASTAHSDAFLLDVFKRLSETFKICNYELIIKGKVYVSQLFVSTDKSLESLNPGLKLISEYLSSNVGLGDRTFQTGSISVWPDQTDKLNPAHFTFERTLGVPFSEKRYYSVAPLPTDKHRELLDKLESILS